MLQLLGKKEYNEHPSYQIKQRQTGSWSDFVKEMTLIIQVATSNQQIDVDMDIRPEIQFDAQRCACMHVHINILSRQNDLFVWRTGCPSYISVKFIISAFISPEILTNIKVGIVKELSKQYALQAFLF